MGDMPVGHLRANQRPPGDLGDLGDPGHPGEAQS